MIKILRIEFMQYIKDPLIYGFFILPIILFIALSSVFSIPVALSSVTFIQMLLISFFVYGNKIMIYKNDTIKKKINNSKVNWLQIISALLILNILTIFSTLLIPFLITMTQSHSLTWLYENQWWFFMTSKNNVNSVLAAGLPDNFLLFNSNFSTFMQFFYVYVMTNFICLSFAHLLTCASKDQVRYFSITITLSLVIILISDIFSKDMFIMTDGAYTQDSQMINNGLWQTIKRINPFYWVNEMLMNSIVADTYSGNWEAGTIDSGYVDSLGNAINLNGIWTPSYFEIFHVGTNANPNINTQRPVAIQKCEVSQLLTIFVPIITPLSFTTWSFVLTEVNK